MDENAPTKPLAISRTDTFPTIKSEQTKDYIPEQELDLTQQQNCDTHMLIASASPCKKKMYSSQRGTGSQYPVLAIFDDR